MTLPILRTISDVRAQSAIWQTEGLRVGIVPTMGALHAGHLSLIDALLPHAERIIVSIFINPTQFAENEDLTDYPRTQVQDLEKLAATPAHAVYMPSNQVVYPQGFATTIVPQGVALGLESDYRPHFFSGVASVVAKLFSQTQANVAAFGEKDYQQLLVIRQMVRDLNMPIKIIGAPIMRETDGLAMSSRNAYLTTTQRPIAARLNVILRELANSTHTTSEAEARANAQLSKAGFTQVDYACLRDADTLSTIAPNTTQRRALIDALIDDIRLLDNMACP